MSFQVLLSRDEFELLSQKHRPVDINNYSDSSNKNKVESFLKSLSEASDEHITDAVTKVCELTQSIKCQELEAIYLTFALEILNENEKFKESLTSENFDAAIESIAVFQRVYDCICHSPFKNLSKHCSSTITWATFSVEEKLIQIIDQCLMQLKWPNNQIDITDTDNRHQVDVLLKAVSSLYHIFMCLRGSITENSSDKTRQYFPSIQGKSPHEKIVKILIKPIRIRLEFHYGQSGKRATSRIDRPEWLLSAISKYLETLLPLFIDEALVIPDEVDTCGALFIQHLFELGYEILNQRMPVAQEDAFLLSHTFNQVFDFEKKWSSNLNIKDYNVISRLLLQNYRTVWISNEAESLHSAFRELESKIRSKDTKVIKDQDKILNYELIPQLIDDLFIPLITPFIQDVLLKAIAYNPESGSLYLQTAIVPLLETLHRSVSFAVLPFHQQPIQVKCLVQQAIAIDKLVNVLQNWGNLPEALELGASSQFLEKFGYDASVLPGSIFSRAISAFRESILWERIITGHLEAYAWESFSNPCTIFARSMHYGVYREDVNPKIKALPMNDDLRRSLLAFSDSVALLGALPTSILSIVHSNLYNRISKFFFERVLLTGFYLLPLGPTSFLNDTRTASKIITSALSQVDPQLINEQGPPLLIKSIEAGILMETEASVQSELQKAIHLDEFDKISSVLKNLSITSLNISECEKILSLVRN